MKCGQSAYECHICRKGRAGCEILRENDRLIEENANLTAIAESRREALDEQQKRWEAKLAEKDEVINGKFKERAKLIEELQERIRKNEADIRKLLDWVDQVDEHIEAAGGPDPPKVEYPKEEKPKDVPNSTPEDKTVETLKQMDAKMEAETGKVE